MAEIKQGDLSINNTIVGYDAEGKVRITPGSTTSKLHPQVNASPIAMSDVTTNFSTITIPIRVTDASNEQFDEYKANGDANVIYFRAKSYSNCILTTIPEREDNGVVDYVFEGRPEA